MPLRPDLRVLLAWKLPLGALKSLPNLAWVQLAGAGAEHFLHRDDLPVDTVLTRSPGRFGIQVAEYTLGYLLFFLLGLEQYRQDQRTRTWQPRPAAVAGGLYDRSPRPGHTGKRDCRARRYLWRSGLRCLPTATAHGPRLEGCSPTTTGGRCCPFVTPW